jgi:hypothetical protein
MQKLLTLLAKKNGAQPLRPVFKVSTDYFNYTIMQTDLISV